MHMESPVLEIFGLYSQTNVPCISEPFQWLAMKTPRQGAQTSIYLSVASDVEGVSGSYFE